MGDPPAPTLRVAFDATPLIGQRTGVGHVTAGFLRELTERDVDVHAYAVTRAHTRALTGIAGPSTEVRSTRLPAPLLLRAWSRVSAPRIERWVGTVDVVHGTNFVVPPARVPRLVTVHDLAFRHLPEVVPVAHRRFDRLVRRALANGAHVHAVSDHVARAVIETYGIPAERVTRVYAGIAPTDQGDPAAGRTAAGCDRYVLALGTVEPRKNLPRLVDAFDRIARLDRDLHLVVAGPDGWGVDAFDAAVSRAAHGSRVRRLGYVPDGTRADLLAGAEVFAYPSLDEGFGHPPLEAMGAGVPVVASSGGALPESCGDAALLPDPTDVDAIAAALETAITDGAARARLVTAGRRRVQCFPWSRAGEELVALYARIASRSSA